MGLIVSKNEVCNLALSRLKVPPITNIDATNPTQIESLCALWFDLSRQIVIRSHPWNFAKKSASINLSTTAPTIQYTDAYGLPNNYLRLRFIGEENLGLVGIDYEIEEDKRLLINNGNGATLDIGYVKDVTNIAKWDALAIKCLSLTVADNIGYGIVGKNVLKDKVIEDLKQANIEAKAINGQENPPKRITRSAVIGGRRRYASGSTLGLRNVDDLLI